MSGALELSVLICTRNRAESLRETVETLARSCGGRALMEVVVVDNGHGDETPRVVETLRKLLPVRYLKEPEGQGYGKGPGLNLALALPGLGSIVVVLDDDMSVDPGWVEGVLAISKRWPDCDVFTGRSRVNREPGSLPGWLADPRIYGWVLSVVDRGMEDFPFSEGGAVSGNHFWVRSRVLSAETRFDSIWNPELGFFNTLFDRGHRGMYGPEASVVHRIQDELLDPAWALSRAERVGITTARMRMMPYRETVNAARLMKRHPLAGRCFCAAQWARWVLLGAASTLARGDRRVRWKILSAHGRSYYSELLRLSISLETYRWFHSWPISLAMVGMLFLDWGGWNCDS